MKAPKKSKDSRRAKKRSVKGATPAAAKTAESFPVVGIGASAGGLEAFTELLHHLPEKTGMAFVLVQHLDPTHGSVLPEILSRTTKIPVAEVTDGMTVQPDHIYVIPANTNMAIEGQLLRLGARTLTRAQHMPIDHFFLSLAEDRGERAIGVILSGTASDGTQGCLAIKTAGGITFAQDERSARYNSMPRSAVASGSVDFVLPPRRIALELARIGKHPYIGRALSRKETASAKAEREQMEALFAMVREASGVDFTQYKQSTLQRRIKRRMVLHHLDKLKDYLRYIHKTPGELDALYRDILIHVTGFFRDPEAFQALRKHVLPNLFKDRKLDEAPIRVWVPGCSTGEEVYSIAITLLEYAGHLREANPLLGFSTKGIQVFATDISDAGLDQAREGAYTPTAVSGVSAEQLKRFFVRSNGGYQIAKPIREMCIFAKQDVTRDPPFSNLDVVSCRNLLIYLGPELQKRVIPTLHYALKPNGYLMLGQSESLGTFPDHFSLVDKKNKIYQKKGSGAPLPAYFGVREYHGRRAGTVARAQPFPPGPSVEKEVDRALADRFVPASIVVNDDMEIVQFRGKTGAYLEPAPGHPTFSLTKMAREGLLVDLREALGRAKKSGEAVRKEGVRIQSNGGAREINLEVIPLAGGGPQERLYVIAFQEKPRTAPGEARGKGKGGKPAAGEKAIAHERDRAAREVKELRAQLQSLIEENETAVEEYKASNEEVLSANEELQSTNEELETAKEELQSANEELTTLNEELQNRNMELATANNDLNNLLANANIPVVMVGNDARIRWFTPPAEKLLNLIPADLGRRLGEIRSNLEMADDLEHLCREVIEHATPQEREVREKGGGWYLMHVRPYMTAERKLEGVVISYQDIDALKRTLDLTRSVTDAVIQNARESVLILDEDLRVTRANPAFYRDFQVNPGDTENRLIYELGNRQWDIPALRSLLNEVTRKNARVDDFEVRHEFPHLGPRAMLLNARWVESQEGRKTIILSIEDVTDRLARDAGLRRQSALLDLVQAAIIVRDMKGRVSYWNHGAEEMYGWTLPEALEKGTRDLLKTQFPRPFQGIEAELQRTGRWEGELVQSRKDGTRIVVSSRWALLEEEGKPLQALEINTDISARRHAENQLRQLSTYLMRVQDEERRRMARDLHDSTGQKLVAAKMQMDVLAKRFDAKSKERSDLDEASALAREAIEEIRTLAQVLHPPALDKMGLVATTRSLVEGFTDRSGIKVEFAAPGEFGRLTDDAELALFRVIQECLTNIHRHSGAKKARIELAQTPERITLEIRDDGKGFSLNGPQSSPEGQRVGVGILGMKERLAQLGGTLEITSGEKGTSVKAILPNHNQRPA